MNPYYQPTHPSQQSHDKPTHPSQQNHYRHSLSSTTDPSAAYYQASHAAGYPASAAPPSAPYPHASSQYAAYPEAASAQIAAQHLGDPRGYVEHPSRNLPYTTTHAADMQAQMQAHGAYPGMPPQARDPYAHQFNAHAGYAQGPARHAVHHETRYIPTPAQTMQSYQSLPSRGATLTPPQSSPSPGVERYACEKCDRTFSRPHDRKRHYESQHLQTSHKCQYCRKEFSRADSLKRHLDNGCDKVPVA